MVNQGIFGVLFFTAIGPALSGFRRFEGKSPQDVNGHGHQAWVALREKVYGRSQAALRAEYYEMNNIKMTPGQDPEEVSYMMDSRRDRLNSNSPPEGYMDQQYEDVLLQALSPEYENIRRAHLEKLDSDLANTWRKMAATYADNLSRRSIILGGIVGPGAALQTMDRDLSNVRCHNCLMFGHYRRNYPNNRNQHQQGGQNQQHPDG